MTFIVPFDGSELAEAALVRAHEFGRVLDERVVAVTILPDDNAKYAREHGWIGPDEPFDREAIVSDLHERVTALCPAANYRHEIVDRYASTGTIANRIREIARREEVSMVFIGSENAGRIVSSVSSVGDSIAASQAYDVVIVRQRRPSLIAKVKEASPYRKPKSDFYLPE